MVFKNNEQMIRRRIQADEVRESPANIASTTMQMIEMDASKDRFSNSNSDDETN